VAVLFVALKVPTEQVTPTSELEVAQVKVGVAEKLFTGANVRVEVPVPPGATVTLLGDALSEKSVAPVAKEDMFDQVPYTPLVEDNACTSQ
jgi:hypothetical protein